MTAYAQLPLTINSRRFRLEIQSLNKKGLDIQLDLPSTFLSLAVAIRLYSASCIERGSIVVRLKEESQGVFGLNQDDLKTLKTQLVELATSVGYKQEAICFEYLMEKAGSIGASAICMEDLEPYLKKGFDLLIDMRLQEGARLQKDFKIRLQLIESLLAKVDLLQKNAPLMIKDKLLERLKGLDFAGHDEERLAKEVIFYVEKQDVSEELTRLGSHLIQMNQLIESRDACGRRLEFLTQECFRELNTLSAKTSSLEVINLTLALKTEFEKIKEQVMNIE
jgi:uncharacterized protein (TIGR00255 family)